MQSQLPPNRLTELRKANGLERYDLAAHLRVDPTTIWRWEKHGGISDEAKIKLAALFEVSIEYLMGWDRLDAGAAA